MKEQLTKKLGPMPMWVWVALIAVAAGGFYLWKKNQSGSTSGTATNAASTNTGSSQLPAGTGYAVVGGSGTDADNWQGYNNPGPGPSTQGPGSTVQPTSMFQQLIGGSTPGSTMTQLNGVLKAGQKAYVQIEQGVFAPYVPGSTPVTSPVYILQPSSGPISGIAGGGTGPPIPGNVGASSATAAPGVSSVPQPLNAVQTGPLNAGSPASAIAPSALQPVTQ